MRWSEGHNDPLGDYINTGCRVIRPIRRPIRGAHANPTAGDSRGLNSVLSPTKVNEFNLGYTKNSILFLTRRIPVSRSFRIFSRIPSCSGAAPAAFR